ncbi:MULTISPECIES: hypothetical protein [Nostoc]|uniref:Uncharacterized protein n=1 Tax=Nostoc paludosum FACHB-159 TaxID=2692908 RepID=A0ABR8KJQ0_9NOSO|nr:MULTISPECIES: hypothetical protein [Nostoc]MBD2682182.1 hypothetical protein [Nostoc sp. FACHB-857]MBD2738510.1 hypothetical protein [Nostoc paludosum FACHB-159]
MGQLFGRIKRLVKAELNYSKSEISTDNYEDAVALAVLGGVAGASLGKIGILAKGTGLSVGAVPLTATGGKSSEDTVGECNTYLYFQVLRKLKPSICRCSFYL